MRLQNHFVRWIVHVLSWKHFHTRNCVDRLVRIAVFLRTYVSFRQDVVIRPNVKTGVPLFYLLRAKHSLWVLFIVWDSPIL
jgi:hypothetical protein